jgi:hypothetical protein
MTDCHDWFAELAEAFVRYVVSHAGFEVFGQSEWGADLAIHDRSGRWSRCEVRSSSIAAKSSEVKQKATEKLTSMAEIEALVWTSAPTLINIRFLKLNEQGHRCIESIGGSPISHDYKDAESLKQWMNTHAFWRNPLTAMASPNVAGE